MKPRPDHERTPNRGWNLPGLRSLRGRLVLALGALMLAQMAYFGFLWLPAGNAWAERQATTQAQEHLLTLGESLVPYLLQRQLAAVNETLDYVAQREPHWRQITLVNSRGVRVYPLGGALPDLGDRAGVVISQPVIHNGNTLAVLSLDLDLAAHSAGWVTQNRRLGLVLSLVSLLSVLLVGAIVEVLVIRPARSLQRAAASMARGDYGAAIPRGGTDEIGSLAVAFTEMRDEIHRQQDGLQQAKEDAESASHSKSLFLATMSHEIRTPLNGIIAVAHLMKDMPMPPKQAEFLDTVLRSANHLLAVISDILDFSKIEAGKLELAPEPMRPVTLAGDMKRLMPPLAEARGIAFDMDCGAPDDLTVLGDINRLRQVLLNLCTNAIKFTEEGGVRLECRVAGILNGHATLRYTVEDTGIGMSDEVRARLFDRFMQADPGHAREYGGTGLGLAISKQIVELMGGVMRVESEPGQGSRFWFDVRLPVVALPKEEPRVVAVAPEPPRDPVRLRVLVAEDDEVNQFIIENLLEMEGHACLLAVNGRDAVDAARDGDFDVIIMDMQMPVMDGLEATRAIRRLGGRYAGIPIIALTANASEEARRECEAAGMSHFVTKPMDPDDLVRLLEGFGNGDS